MEGTPQVSRVDSILVRDGIPASQADSRGGGALPGAAELSGLQAYNKTDSSSSTITVLLRVPCIAAASNVVGRSVDAPLTK